MRRADVTLARRIVVKIGSSSLTGADGRLRPEVVRRIADVAARLVAEDREIVIVSSGAIAASLAPLDLPARPTDVPTQQAAASVGQALLARAWSEAFAAHDLITGQVLLTEADVIRSHTYTSVRTALEALLALGAVPVINENDTTATHEIRFGDNDRLAALVAQLLGADLVVLLTDVDAPSEPGSRRIPQVADADVLEGVSVGSVGSAVGTGGMVTKLSAAQHAATTGTATVLTSTDNFAEAVAGADVGTFFPARHGRRRSRLVWLRFATRGAGTLHVDEGAASALVSRRRSLLAVGVTRVSGTFAAGVPVDVQGPGGNVIARGLVAFSSDELHDMLGRSTGDLRAERGSTFGRPVIHRDDLVLL
jgi:glutamate 5-kinase